MKPTQGETFEMDVSKLKFNVSVNYDCDEGEGCSRKLKDATWDETMELFGYLDEVTYIENYYHSMDITFSVIDENGKEVKFPRRMMKDYGWILEYGEYNTYSDGESTDTPRLMMDLLNDLKKSDSEYAKDKKREIQDRIKELESELNKLKRELEKLN